MKTLFKACIGKFFTCAVMTAALFAGALTPAVAQTPLSTSTSYTLVSLGGSASSAPSTLYGGTFSTASQGVAVIGTGGSVTFCSGYVGQNFLGYSAGTPFGSCVVAGHISTPISNWGYVVIGSMITFINQQSGQLYRCGGVTDLNLGNAPPFGSCQNLGNISK